MQIKTCSLAQFGEIEVLYRTCGIDMLKKGFDNWGDFYPPKEVIEEDLKNETIWGLFVDEELAGVIVLNAIQPTQFETINWAYNLPLVLVVHRLAIAVNQQGKGYAKQLMKFAESYGLQEGYGAIRLDAYSINENLLKFYERLGYQRTKEAIYLGAEWQHPFICFEKRLEAVV